MRATVKKENPRLTDTDFFNYFRIFAKFLRKVITGSERWILKLYNQLRNEMIWVN
jgi:hypothetical protein